MVLTSLFPAMFDHFMFGATAAISIRVETLRMTKEKVGRSQLDDITESPGLDYSAISRLLVK